MLRILTVILILLVIFFIKKKENYKNGAIIDYKYKKTYRSYPLYLGEYKYYKDYNISKAGLDLW